LFGLYKYDKKENIAMGKIKALVFIGKEKQLKKLKYLYFFVLRII